MCRGLLQLKPSGLGAVGLAQLTEPSLGSLAVSLLSLAAATAACSAALQQGEGAKEFVSRQGGRNTTLCPSDALLSRAPCAPSLRYGQSPLQLGGALFLH